MTMSRLEAGRLGEEKAARFLRKSGYKLLTRNFRNRLGEVDIIALDKDVVCFIEVRTRRGLRQHERAFESVSFLKQQTLSKLAVSFLKKRGWLARQARFDVISVSLSDETDGILLIKDAFPVAERYS